MAKELAPIVVTENYNPWEDWKCPATGLGEPGDRGHRFHTIYRADPLDGDALFCKRCGLIRLVPR